MERALDFKGQAAVSLAKSFGGMTVVPIMAASETIAEYTILDDALAAGTFTVEEVSEAGSVNNLVVVNSGDRPVLLLDGDEVVGAKQNRIFNLTILVAAKARLTVPVSCVEAGRWQFQSRRFRSSRRAQYASGRSERLREVTRSMATTGERRSDQGEVWRGIAAKARKLRAESPTSAMSEIYERHSQGIEDYVTAFPSLAGQAGAVFCIGSRIGGVEVFDAPATFSRWLPRLVRSYAIEAIEANIDGEVDGPPPTPGAIEEFLEAIARCEQRAFPAVGLGTDVRFEGPSVSGAALARDDLSLVHLAAFATGLTAGG